MTGLSLYVHAPFCARRCCYCDFAVTVDRSPEAGPWLDAVEAEFANDIEREGLGRPALETIYVGGGTPSMLGPGAMPGLRDRLERHASIGADAEWTVEANPENFDGRLAADWRAAGVNRVSLGVQSFDPAVLSWMGRLHGPEDSGRALDTARLAGFSNVSVDLIFGLPARLGRDWEADLQRALELRPQHIPLYGLTAERRTPLGARVAEGRERLADEDSYAGEYLQAAHALTAEGFRHYEVSNFALPGCESRHNGACWASRPYLGLGPGAHSFLPPRRWWNTKDWADYRERVGQVGAAVDAEERLDQEAVLLERAWLDLRTAGGAAVETEAQQQLAVDWTGRGWAHPGGGRIRLTPAGWLLLDRLAVEYAETA